MMAIKYESYSKEKQQLIEQIIDLNINREYLKFKLDSLKQINELRDDSLGIKIRGSQEYLQRSDSDKITDWI